MTFTYPAVMRQLEDGTYEGYFPDLDGCTFRGVTMDETIDAAIVAEKEWIEVELDVDEDEESYGNPLPLVSESSDIPLKEGEFIRSIGVIMHFEVGYY